MKSNGKRKAGQRVFVALDPPSAVREEAEAWARQLARGTHGLRVVPARNSHITLAFMAQRDEYEIESIIDAMTRSAGPVGGLGLGAPVWLPRRRPRNLVLDIHDDRGQLARCQEDLARELRRELGWREERPYRPHLTCARTGRGFDPSGLLLPISPSISFEGRSMTLYSSRLRPEGAEYEAIERLALGQPDHEEHHEPVWARTAEAG